MRALIIALAVLTPGLASAEAIFTTNIYGTVVNQNIYGSPQDVYLSGGPQNGNPNGLTPGIYYFQVTDPSGATLLSTDLAVDRMLIVNSAGRIAGSYDPDGPGGATPHQNGIYNPLTGITPVQLWPFDPTPNDGGEYKAWAVISIEDVTGIDEDGMHLIFKNKYAATDNFKIDPVASVPEPSSMVILGIGAFSLAGYGWRRRSRA